MSPPLCSTRLMHSLSSLPCKQISVCDLIIYIQFGEIPIPIHLYSFYIFSTINLLKYDNFVKHRRYNLVKYIGTNVGQCQIHIVGFILKGFIRRVYMSNMKFAARK